MADNDGIESLPREGRLAGIDFGTVRVGIAVCDAGQSIASPYENYHRRNERLDAAYFRTLANEESIVGWVVGLPVHMSGDESQKSQEARRFGEWLRELTDLPVGYFDERFTTAMAREFLRDSGLSAKKRKAKLDQLAAQILLTSFLESSRDGSFNQSLDESRGD